MIQTSLLHHIRMVESKDAEGEEEEEEEEEAGKEGQKEEEKEEGGEQKDGERESIVQEVPVSVIAYSQGCLVALRLHEEWNIRGGGVTATTVVPCQKEGEEKKEEEVDRNDEKDSRYNTTNTNNNCK